MATAASIPVLAPFSGTVIAELEVSVGDTLQEGQRLAQLQAGSPQAPAGAVPEAPDEAPETRQDLEGCWPGTH